MNVKANTMLETKQAISAPPRSARAARVAAPSPVQTSRRPSAPAPGRLARSEARLLALAVTGTIVVCGLLVLYLAAYAHVSDLGMEQSRRQREWRAARQQNELLRARLAVLQNPKSIARAARAQGMAQGASRVDYLAARIRPGTPTRAAAGDDAAAGRQQRRTLRHDADIQVAIRGKTDDNTSASPDH